MDLVPNGDASAPPPKKVSGGKRMMELGKKPMQLWLTVEEMDLIAAAAKAERRPKAHFVLFHALAAAKKMDLPAAQETP